jgi:hypothetical protein
VTDVKRNEYSYLPLLRDFALEHELTVPSHVREDIALHCEQLLSNLDVYFPVNLIYSFLNVTTHNYSKLIIESRVEAKSEILQAYFKKPGREFAI